MVKEGYKEVRIGPKKELLPCSWEKSKIKDLLKIKSGYAFKSDDYVEDGIFMLRVTNINDNGEIKKGNGETKYLPEEYLKEYKKYQLENNDILLVMVGASTGKIGKVDNDILPAILNQNMWNLKPKSDNLDKSYFYYSILKEINRFLSMKIGSARSYIKKGDFKKFEIPLPPLPEQKKIASILSSVDNSIEKTDEVIEKTKELKKGLMQELLTKGIGHSEFKEVRIGPKKVAIPKEWDLKTLDKIKNEIYAGGTPSRSKDEYFNGEIPWVKSGELNQNFISNIEEKITKKALDNSSAKIVPKNNVLVAMYGATAGQVGYLTQEATTNQAVLAIIPNQDLIDSMFLYYLLSKEMTRIVKQRQQGTGQQNLSKTLITDMDIFVPPLEEQKKIASILSSVDSKIQKEEEYKAKLEQLKKGLMQKLLTGEIRVNTEMEV